MNIYVYYIITIRKNGMVARPLEAIVPSLFGQPFSLIEAIAEKGIRKYYT